MARESGEYKIREGAPYIVSADIVSVRDTLTVSKQLKRERELPANEGMAVPKRFTCESNSRLTLNSGSTLSVI